MDVYFITNGNSWDTYCQHCADHFIFQGGDLNDVDGPHDEGGGESDKLNHCDRGCKCIQAMQTKFGFVGVCFRNDLTDEGVTHTLEAIQAYVDERDGVPEVLDIWAEELLDYTLDINQCDILSKYDKARIKDRENANLDVLVDRISGYKKKQDTKVSSMMAFFDDRPVVSKSIHCGSCKDTGVIMLFNSSVECTDCAKSLKNAAALEIDILF